MKRAITVFLAIAVALSVVGMAFAGGALATEHTTTLAGDGTDAVEGFNASEDEYLLHTIEADGADFGEDGTETVYLNVTYDGEEYTAYSADVDAADANYEVNISHDELETLPGDATEVTITEANAWGEDADGTETTALATFNVDFEFANTHAVRTVHSDDDEIVTEFEPLADEDDGFLASLAFWSASDEIATLEDDIGIDGDNTTVQVYAEDSDVADVMDEQIDDAEDGDRVGMLMASSLDDTVVYVFANEAGETITGDDVTEDDTYIVLNEGGHAEINLGDEYEDEEEVSMSLTAGEKFDRSALQDDLDYSVFEAWGLTLGSLPFVGMLAGGIVVTRRRVAA